MYEFYTENKRRTFNSKKVKKTIVAAATLLFLGILVAFLLPPGNFPADTIVTITPGSSLEEIANNFEDKGLVKSAGIFKTFVIASGGDRNIEAGDYLFKSPLSSFDLALRVAHGEFGVKKIAVTLPEGLTVKEMNEILSGKLPEWNEEEFLYMARDLEGYLFPDTYFFFPTAKPTDVIRMMRDTFDQKVTSKMRADIVEGGKDFDDILTMASIIQNEAFDGYEEKQMISGILWKRLAKGMRLQADATVLYGTNREGKVPVLKDLSSDNPYNTYTRDGLPPTPIGNPGLEAIKAAIYPKDSEYFFYVHDAKGKVHYAKTFDEHKKNIAAFLK